MGLTLKRKARFAARAPRDVRSIRTALLLPDGREIFVHIRNMSNGGFMAIADEELAVDTWLGAEIPGRGIVRAQVAGSKAGCWALSSKSRWRCNRLSNSVRGSYCVIGGLVADCR